MLKYKLSNVVLCYSSRILALKLKSVIVSDILDSLEVAHELQTLARPVAVSGTSKENINRGKVSRSNRVIVHKL